MTVLVTIPGVPTEPNSVLLTTTAATDIKTFTAGSTGIAYITSIIVVNRDSSARLVTVWWTNDTTDYPIYEASVPANSTVNALDAPLAFNAKSTAKKIRAQAATANVVTVTVVHTLSSQQNSQARA